MQAQTKVLSLLGQLSRLFKELGEGQTWKILWEASVHFSTQKLPHVLRPSQTSFLVQCVKSLSCPLWERLALTTFKLGLFLHFLDAIFASCLVMSNWFAKPYQVEVSAFHFSISVLNLMSKPITFFIIHLQTQIGRKPEYHIFWQKLHFSSRRSVSMHALLVSTCMQSKAEKYFYNATNLFSQSLVFSEGSPFTRLGTVPRQNIPTSNFAGEATNIEAYERQSKLRPHTDNASDAERKSQVWIFGSPLTKHMCILMTSYSLEHVLSNKSMYFIFQSNSKTLMEDFDAKKSTSWTLQL